MQPRRRSHCVFATRLCKVTFTEAVDAARNRPEVRAAVAELYARVAAAIAARAPVCVVSGKCCGFEDYGHRLFVTTIELAAFVYDVDLAAPMATWDGTGCPLQRDGLCTAHAVRPFGCRIFFCDPSADQWQMTQYELFHRELKTMHERFDVPYHYVEWRQSLQAVRELPYSSGILREGRGDGPATFVPLNVRNAKPPP